MFNGMFQKIVIFLMFNVVNGYRICVHLFCGFQGNLYKRTLYKPVEIRYFPRFLSPLDILEKCRKIQIMCSMYPKTEN